MTSTHADLDVPNLDVVDLLTQDHRDVEVLFAEIDALQQATDEVSLTRRKDLTEQVTIELVKHSVAEEVAVYPEIARKVSEAEAQRLVQEQAEAEVTMKELESLHPGQADYELKLTTLMSQIRAHVAEEETEAFPALRAAFTHDELVKIAGSVKAVKAIAPTRPHPLAPDTPPGNILLGPMTGLFDRLRDAVTHRGL